MTQTPGLQESLKDGEAPELGTVVYSGHQEGRKPGAEGVLDLAIVKVDLSVRRSRAIRYVGVRSRHFEANHEANSTKPPHLDMRAKMRFLAPSRWPPDFVDELVGASDLGLPKSYWNPIREQIDRHHAEEMEATPAYEDLLVPHMKRVEDAIKPSQG